MKNENSLESGQQNKSTSKTFDSFLSLFNKKKLSLEHKNSTYETISKEVSSLITSKMFIIVFEYLESGYILQKEQQIQLYKKINQLDDNEKINLFSQLVDKNLPISDELLLSQLSFIMFYNEKYKIHKDTNAIVEGRNFIDFAMSRVEHLDISCLYQDWVVEVTKLCTVMKKPIKLFFLLEEKKFYDNITKNIINPIKSFNSLFFKNKSLKEILDILESLNLIKEKIDKRERHYSSLINISDPQYLMIARLTKIFNELNEIMPILEEIPKKYCQEQIKNNKKEISLLFSEAKINQLISQEYRNLQQKTNIKDLPKAAQEILDNIKNDYLSLNKVSKELSESEQFEVENLWSKRIPQVINKYLSVSPEFRTTMKNNNGQSIEDLLIDSLHNMSEKLKEINTNHSQNVLHDMSAMNRYTKNLKL